MANPFDYLMKQHEERERQQRERFSNEIQKRYEFEWMRTDVIEKYGEIVKVLLEELRLAAYPDSLLSVVNDANGRWSCRIRHHLGPSGEPDEVTLVEVELELDSDDKPIGFRCTRNGKQIRTGFSREELTRALTKLHPK